MRKFWLFTCLLLLLGEARPAHAGSIITTNLPAGTTIMNIDGTVDGATGNDPAGGLFSQPYPTDISISVPAGTYEFSVIDPADAIAEFPALSAAQIAEIQTGWTYNPPGNTTWTTDYVVFDLAATTNPNETQLFDGGDDTYDAADNYNSAQEAYDAARAGGYYNDIRTGSRDTTTVEKSYTFTSPTTLLFAVPDYYLSDNAGGVSVVVQSVPEPGAMTLLGAGGLLLMAAGRWRASANRLEVSRVKF